MINNKHNVIINFHFWIYLMLCLQCCDIVGWASGRASGP